MGVFAIFAIYSISNIVRIEKNDPLTAIKVQIVDRNVYEIKQSKGNSSMEYTLDVIVNNNVHEIDCSFEEYKESRFKKTIWIKLRKSFIDQDKKKFEETEESIGTNVLLLIVIGVVALFMNLKKFTDD